MPNEPLGKSIEPWLSLVRCRFSTLAPDLLTLFEIYAAEAVFGRSYIESDLACIQQGTRILEVGAGSLLLSCQLVREGFDVTALEPVGDGFTHFEKMKQLVLAAANLEDCCPKIVEITAEELDAKDCFDYVFSVNVMEHVTDVTKVLENVTNSLTVGSLFRFTCPNYNFPYEPHFNIPTLFSKNLTEKILWSKILKNKVVPDPIGAWRSLNWINVFQIKNHFRGTAGFKVAFSRTMLVSTFDRVVTDTGFSERRSPLVRNLIVLLVRMRVHQLLRFIPAFMQPIIDCRVEKIAESRGEAHGSNY